VSWGRLSAENYRGVRVPRILGFALATAAAVSAPLVGITRHVGAAGWGAEVGVLLVFAAGLIDDLVPIGPRGLRNHLRSLLDGHMTTGILKLMVIAASAVIMIALQPVRAGWVRVLGVVLVAASANVGNALDVRPGRALKVFLPAAALLVLAGVPSALVPVFPFVGLAAIVVLPLDLRERAMLGDGGANLLGSVAGIASYAALPDWGVAFAAAITVAVNVLADTVGLSQMIDSVPPARWYDRLGRLRAPS
jgi:UDP-GlcNAc:undecaprenyl-phosphate/decaprenyl-phosphate GlcNAc-1-phosphate transferase